MPSTAATGPDDRPVERVCAGHRQPGVRRPARLLDYCARSANPIGRLLLHLSGIDEPMRCAQSDAICTALQLINFWQDLRVDLPRGRLYVPAGRCRALRPDPRQLRAGADCDAQARPGARAVRLGRARRFCMAHPWCIACPAGWAGSCALSSRAACAYSRRSRLRTTRAVARPTISMASTGLAGMARLAHAGQVRPGSVGTS